MIGVKRVDSTVLRPLLYEGGESSRLYDGQYKVVAGFTWPVSGQPGEMETSTADYLSCQRYLLLLGEGVPVLVGDPDTGVQWWVRAEWARIEEA